MGLLALQVAAAVDHQPGTVALTRELRAMLHDLTVSPNDAPGVVDEIRALYLKRRVEALLRVAALDQVDRDR